MDALEFFLPKTTKGGRGSGHHGHGGLAGVHGGSSPSGKYTNFEKLSKADAKVEHDRFAETMEKLGISRLEADEKTLHACMMTQMALYDILSPNGYGFVVRNKDGLVISAISYTIFLDPEDYVSGTMVVDHFGALEHGAGIRCLEQVFQVAYEKKLTVMGWSAHSSKITKGLQKRYGISVTGEMQFERVDIPYDNLPKILAVLERALK